MNDRNLIVRAVIKITGFAVLYFAVWFIYSLLWRDSFVSAISQVYVWMVPVIYGIITVIMTFVNARRRKKEGEAMA